MFDAVQKVHLFLARVAALSVIGLLAAAQAAVAIPTAVPYFGYLSFASGAAYNGSVNLTVRIYTADTGGDLIWGPHAFDGVVVEDGMFSILLGGGASPDLAPVLDSGQSLWLSFALGGELLTPRQQILAVPFARRAELAANAAALGGQPPGAYVLAADLPGSLPSVSGTSGALPIFTSADSLGDSIATQANDKLGVAVADPQARLHVGGAIQVGDDGAQCTPDRAGSIRFRDGRFEGCGGNAWIALQSRGIATGGAVTEIEGHRVHVFNSSGTLTVSGTISAEVLVVGGGGGGGWGNTNEGGGGGGAGGLCHKTTHMLGEGSYTVTVGTGGGAPGTSSAKGGTGGDSAFDGITAVGGGGGGSCSNPAGANGGSAGGGNGCNSDNPGGSTSQAASSGGATCYGHGGGSGRWFQNSPGQGNGGGGGGAGGAGGNGQSRNSGIVGGAGAGRTYALTGSNITYATGGNGGPGLSSANGSNASPANSGNGGTGGNISGGSGAAGVVMIRYAL